MRVGNQSKLGTIVTYFPFVRLARCELNEQPRLTCLDLATHASHGTETLHVALPPEYAGRAQTLIEHAMQHATAT
jgi:hypothetical protein